MPTSARRIRSALFLKTIQADDSFSAQDEEITTKVTKSTKKNKVLL